MLLPFTANIGFTTTLRILEETVRVCAREAMNLKI